MNQDRIQSLPSQCRSLDAIHLSCSVNQRSLLAPLVARDGVYTKL